MSASEQSAKSAWVAKIREAITDHVEYHGPDGVRSIIFLYSKTHNISGIPTGKRLEFEKAIQAHMSLFPKRPTRFLVPSGHKAFEELKIQYAWDAASKSFPKCLPCGKDNPPFWDH